MHTRFKAHLPICATIGAVVFSFTLPLDARAEQPSVLVPSKCVTIGKPKPNLGFTYRQTESGGNSSAFTDRWEEFTTTGSRLVTKKSGPRGQGAITTVNRHHVENDLLILDHSKQTGADGGVRIDNSTSYKPGVVADPAGRACMNGTWPIGTVKVTSLSAQGQFSGMSDSGTLQIIAIHESITVPAGTFDTVRFRRTMTSAAGVAVDEYWKSTEHGVTVKRVHTMPGGGVTAILQAIK